MNKFVTVLGVAAVATLAGCKDPNYKPFTSYTSQDDVKVVDPTPATIVPPPAPAKPSCKCLPGTKHSSPCLCGAPDCRCIVEVKPLPPPPPPTPAREYTTYIVQNGDYLAKISKKYNISIAAIKKLNGLQGDTIRVGQKLRLPGKVDVGVQQAPVKAAPVKKSAVKSAAKTVATDYTGETKEYAVKSGDTLGSIAYGNGINIRQLKKLNGLTSDALKVGQKLKVPAAAPVKASVAGAQKTATQVAPKESASVVQKAQVEQPPTKVETKEAPVAAKEEIQTPEPIVAAPSVSSEPAVQTYTVQEGDDMTGVSIRFGISSAVIRELNNLPPDAQLTVGQTIKLPAEAQL